MNNTICQPGQEIEIDVTGYASEGEGVGRQDGAVFFVSGAAAGERVLARVLEAGKSFFRAESIRVLKPAAARREPPCPYFGRCGGCQVQHLSYEEQLRFKETRVRDAVERIGGLDGRLVRPARGMEDPWRYRNKISFTVAGDGAAAVVGLMKKNSHEVIPVEDCLLADPAALPIARRALAAVGEEPGGGQNNLRRVMIRASRATGEKMAALFTAPGAPDFPPRLGERIANADPSLVGVVQVATAVDGRAAAGYRTLFGRGHINEALNNFRFQLSPQAFFQVNSSQAEALYAEAARSLGPRTTEHVLDAYCGLGGFALFLSNGAAEVMGIERDEGMAREAGENALRNGVANVRFLPGDLDKGFGPLLRRAAARTTLVVDPPRRGLSSRFIHACAGQAFQRILYASCDPGTLARDCARFSACGFTVSEIIPFDMFPQTAQVECLARLERVE